ncbi:hypothetical protein [Streptomyces sp. 8N616]|uniref:hypothetical protein n=1 Tax=Streptomyces sp. 8N616 TaxID=3457414 RepID=UPI003FD4C09A
MDASAAHGVHAPGIVAHTDPAARRGQGRVTGPPVVNFQRRRDGRPEERPDGEPDRSRSHRRPGPAMPSAAAVPVRETGGVNGLNRLGQTRAERASEGSGSTPHRATAPDSDTPGT